jgi:hypothetical protein
MTLHGARTGAIAITALTTSAPTLKIPAIPLTTAVPRAAFVSFNEYEAISMLFSLSATTCSANKSSTNSLCSSCSELSEGVCWSRYVACFSRSVTSSHCNYLNSSVSRACQWLHRVISVGEVLPEAGSLSKLSLVFASFINIFHFVPKRCSYGYAVTVISAIEHRNSKDARVQPLHH